MHDQEFSSGNEAVLFACLGLSFYIYTRTTEQCALYDGSGIKRFSKSKAC